MTDKNLFQFSDYKAYLRHRLAAKGARSGLRGELARSLGCQNSFISQVLNTEVNLSLEQACRANSFLNHDSQESHFFMLQVQFERAGSKDLASYYQNQIDLILSERTKLATRVSTTHTLSESNQARYYSDWDYSAIHMALAVPHLRSPFELSKAFGLSVKRVESILDFLVNSHLAEFQNGEYRIGQIHLHLSSDSPFIKQHHNNWRIESMKRMEPANSQHLHYSATFSLSKSDFTMLRENLMAAIQKNLEVVKPSPEELIVCQTIDLYPLID